MSTTNITENTTPGARLTAALGALKQARDSRDQLAAIANERQQIAEACRAAVKSAENAAVAAAREVGMAEAAVTLGEADQSEVIKARAALAAVRRAAEKARTREDDVSAQEAAAAALRDRLGVLSQGVSDAKMEVRAASSVLIYGRAAELLDRYDVAARVVAKAAADLHALSNVLLVKDRHDLYVLPTKAGRLTLPSFSADRADPINGDGYENLRVEAQRALDAELQALEVDL